MSPIFAKGQNNQNRGDKECHLKFSTERKLKCHDYLVSSLASTRQLSLIKIQQGTQVDYHTAWLWLTKLPGREENKWLQLIAWRNPTSPLFELLLTTSCQNRNCKPSVLQTGPYQPACFSGPHFTMYYLWCHLRASKQRICSSRLLNTEMKLSWSKFSILFFWFCKCFSFFKTTPKLHCAAAVFLVLVAVGRS